MTSEIARVPLAYTSCEGGRWKNWNTHPVPVTDRDRFFTIEELDHLLIAQTGRQGTVVDYLYLSGVRVHALRFTRIKPNSASTPCKYYFDIWDVKNGLRPSVQFYRGKSRATPDGHARMASAQRRNFAIKRLRGALATLREYGNGAMLDEIEAIVMREIKEAHEKRIALIEAHPLKAIQCTPLESA